MFVLILDQSRCNVGPSSYQETLQDIMIKQYFRISGPISVQFCFNFEPTSVELCQNMCQFRPSFAQTWGQFWSVFVPDVEQIRSVCVQIWTNFGQTSVRVLGGCFSTPMYSFGLIWRQIRAIFVPSSFSNLETACPPSTT